MTLRATAGPEENILAGPVWKKINCFFEMTHSVVLYIYKRRRGPQTSRGPGKTSLFISSRLAWPPTYIQILASLRHCCVGSCYSPGASISPMTYQTTASHPVTPAGPVWSDKYWNCGLCVSQDPWRRHCNRRDWRDYPSVTVLWLQAVGPLSQRTQTDSTIVHAQRLNDCEQIGRSCGWIFVHRSPLGTVT